MGVFKIKGTRHSGLTERKWPFSIKRQEETRLAGSNSWGFKKEKHLFRGEDQENSGEYGAQRLRWVIAEKICSFKRIACSFSVWYRSNPTKTLEKELSIHFSILEFYGQRSLASYKPKCRKESDTTERLTHFQPSQGQAAVCNQNIRHQDPGQSGGRSLQKKPLHSAWSWSQYLTSTLLFH